MGEVAGGLLARTHKPARVRAACGTATGQRPSQPWYRRAANTCSGAGGIRQEYLRGCLARIGKLLAEFGAGQPSSADTVVRQRARPLIEPLSNRELEVLRLNSQRLTNQEIGERLFVALETVKGHRKIFGKLQVQRRTEAVARARELGLA